MAAEIELKLTARAGAPPDTLMRALTHPAMTSLRKNDPYTEQLVSTYYDTPAGALLKQGVSLRIRQAGSAWVQTVKGGGSAVSGLHVRNEYEWPLPGPRIDAKLLATTPWGREIAAAMGQIKAVFKTVIARTEAAVAFADGTRALVCLDQGAIHAGRRKLAVAEMEIELIDGDVARLCELAILLATDLPLSIATASKAARGYALAWSVPASPLRAAPVALPQDIAINDALAALGGECLAQIGTNAEAVAAGLDGEFLHQLRVGVRRLRSLCRLVARATSKEAVAPLINELRWLTGLLGPARDWDVFANETLAAMAAQVGHPQHRREVGHLRARVTRLRGAHKRAAIDAVASSRFTVLMLNAALFFQSLPAHQTMGAEAPQRARDFACAMLGRRHRALCKRGKRHLRDAAPAERHEARIVAKQLRYAAEFFAPLFSSRRAEQYIKTLSRLQGVLGRLNDLATAKVLIDDMAPAGNTPPALAHAVGMLRGWIAATEQFELPTIDKTWATFTKLKPFWD
jgi:triphosphatase